MAKIVKRRRKPKPPNENFGLGSSGSWRDTEKDTTKNYREKLKAGDQVRAGKLGFRGEVKEPGAHDHKTPIGVRAEANGNRKPMRFVSLHHHSTFSYSDGFQLPEAHVRRAAELQMSALPMTEHGNMSSHAKLAKAGDKFGVKPLFGVELYTGAIDETNRSRKKNHLTILARTQDGYESLINLVTRSYAEGFYSEPTVSEEMLTEEGRGLFVFSGCQGSLLFTSLMGGKLVAPEEASFKRALGVARRFKTNFGDRYFIEVQAFPELEQTCRANPQLERIARKLGIGLVGTLDCHYTVPEESEIQMILHNTRPGEDRTLEDMERDWGYDAPLCPPINDNVMYRRLRATGLSHRGAQEAILNTEMIAQDCDVSLPELPMVQYPLPSGYRTPTELWRDWLKEGWKKRGLNRLPPSERERYKKQLKHEMEMIEAKGFENYLLIVADVVRWAKESGEVAVGPGRGSAAASLCVYLLQITEVDPMKYPLLTFERFISPNRLDLPDIDLDFDSETRWKIRSYLSRKYGENRVFNLGTFTGYRAKNSIDDVSRVFKVPKWEAAVLKGQLIERSSGDLRASATIEDTVEQFPESRAVVEKYPELRKAMALEGNIKGFGVHAAGLVIGDVGKVAPVVNREIPKGSGRWVDAVAVDLKDAEQLGLLKMDFLGLNTMTLLEHARTWLGMTWDEVYSLPLDDRATLDGFIRNDAIGIFQYEGQACRLIAGELKPENFDEVCDVPAIARPGPLHNGAAEAYTQVKKGILKPEKWHPAVDKILAPTKFQIVYQEQILRIVHEVGGFDWTATSEIRSIIAKKKGVEEFNRKRQEFLDGVKRLWPDFDLERADALWGSLITAGAYCLTGDTVLERGGAGPHCEKEITIKGLWEAWEGKKGKPIRDKLRSRGVSIVHRSEEDGRLRPAQVKSVWRTGKLPTWEVETASGRMIRGTAEHRLLTPDGPRRIDQLRQGDGLYVDGGSEPYRSAKRPTIGVLRRFRILETAGFACERCGYESPKGDRDHGLEVSHKQSFQELGADKTRWEAESNVQVLCNPCHKRFDYANGSRKKRWSRGRVSVTDPIIRIEPTGKTEWVYDLEMDTEEHNFLANGIVSMNSFNFAHSLVYGLISYWTQYFKQNHPEVFYAAALRSWDDKDKHITLLRDAAKGHGPRPPIPARPPKVRTANESWEPGNGFIKMGFKQIKGVGKKAEDIVARREKAKWKDWADLIEVPGIGPKTIENMEDFARAEDPLGVFAIDRRIAAAKAVLPELDLPAPTHTSLDVPYSQGSHVPVTWIGVAKERNLRDIYETNRAQGRELDLETLKDPHLREFVLMLGDDGEELLRLRVDRWKYPRMKRSIWGIELEKDVVWIQGYKPRWRAAREVYVTRMAVIDMED